MQGLRQWMWLGLCGLVWGGCAEPMGTILEQDALRSAEASVSVTELRAAADMPPMPPPTLWLTSSTDVRSLWRGTDSARKYVLLVAYTVPKNAAGVVGPPRFRAYGVDPSRDAYVFVADGERQAVLGSFTEAMLTQGAVLITTPPGTTFYGACAKVLGSKGSHKARQDGARQTGQEGGDGDDGKTVCGTEPVVRVPVTTGEGGHDPLEAMDFVKLKVLPLTLNTSLQDFQVPGATLIAP